MSKQPNKARKSAGIRALRQSIVRKNRNNLMKDKIKKIKKKIVEFVAKKSPIETIQTEFAKFNSLQDKMAKKNVFHPRKSRRNVSRLWHYIGDKLQTNK